MTLAGFCWLFGWVLDVSSRGASSVATARGKAASSWASGLNAGETLLREASEPGEKLPLAALAWRFRGKFAPFLGRFQLSTAFFALLGAFISYLANFEGRKLRASAIAEPHTKIEIYQVKASRSKLLIVFLLFNDY